MSEITKYLDLKKAERAEDNLLKSEAEKKLQAEFAALNLDDIRNKNNKELAAWQAKYPANSPQFIFASQEWNNRIITRQLKWVRFAAIVGPIATVIAALLGYYLRGMQIDNRPQIQSPPAIEQLNKVPDESEGLHPPRGNPSNQHSGKK